MRNNCLPALCFWIPSLQLKRCNNELLKGVVSQFTLVHKRRGTGLVDKNNVIELGDAKFLLDGRNRFNKDLRREYGLLLRGK
jgi:hypothetical protein